jgi:hypothetical protein
MRQEAGGRSAGGRRQECRRQEYRRREYRSTGRVKKTQNVRKSM